MVPPSDLDPLLKGPAFGQPRLPTKNAATAKSVDHLVKSYCETVGRNANLVLGICVNQDGFVLEKDAALREVYLLGVEDSGRKI